MMTQRPLYHSPHHQWPFKTWPCRDEILFIGSGSPEPGEEMKPLGIYSNTAVVPPLSGSTLLLPPPLGAGWAQGRHPQMRQTSPFSCIVSIWGSHCAKFWQLQTVLDQLLWLKYISRSKSQGWIVLKKKRNILCELQRLFDLLWEKRIVSLRFSPLLWCCFALHAEVTDCKWYSLSFRKVCRGANKTGVQRGREVTGEQTHSTSMHSPSLL